MEPQSREPASFLSVNNAVTNCQTQAVCIHLWYIFFFTLSEGGSMS